MSKLIDLTLALVVAAVACHGLVTLLGEQPPDPVEPPAAKKPASCAGAGPDCVILRFRVDEHRIAMCAITPDLPADCDMLPAEQAIASTD